MIVVGVLALQGDFPTHKEVLARRGFAVREVRRGAHLEGVAGLVLPGGESTTMLHLTRTEKLEEPLRVTVASGLPVLATCAGVILLARLGLLDVDVERNAYGRQIASGVFPVGGAPATFLRAPRITRTGPRVEVLAHRGADPVLVRQGAILAATFHPEIGDHPAYDLYLTLLAAKARSPQSAERAE